jgi:hypothetical protein
MAGLARRAGETNALPDSPEVHHGCKNEDGLTRTARKYTTDFAWFKVSE